MTYMTVHLSGGCRRSACESCLSAKYGLILSRKKLHFGKKCAGKVVDLIVDRPNTYGIWKGYTRVSAIERI